MMYYFARADQMEEHKYTDDVAVTRALTKRMAIKKFGILYEDVKPHEVGRVKPSRYHAGVQVLTDY